MNKYFKFIITTVIILSISVYIVFYYSVEPESYIDPALIPAKKALLDLQSQDSFQQLSEKEQVEKIKAVLEMIPDSHKKLRHQYQLALSPLPDISFYGRIIDQYDVPVKNARIWYIGEGGYLASGGGQGFAVTDEQGYFEIETTGASLTLGSIKHPELGAVSYDTPDRLINDLKSPLARTVRFLRNSKDNSLLSYTQYSSKENAYLIHVWRLGDYEGAIRGQLDGFYESTGKYYTLIFGPRSHEGKKIEGRKDGHLHISCKKEAVRKFNDNGDWSLTIVPVNGGIQETTDLYMNEAPQSGYASSINISMNKESKEYRPYLRNKRYYFVSNNGKQYGSLFIDIEAFSTNDSDMCPVYIYYKLNPTGSRSLELIDEATSKPEVNTEPKVIKRLS